jgi:transcription factor TFIIIB component B''
VCSLMVLHKAYIHVLFVDIQALSRMTGKDFSGPTPEIRAPTPLTLAEKPSELDPETFATNIRKKSRTPHLSNGSEEIIGEVLDFDEKDD